MNVRFVAWAFAALAAPVSATTSAQITMSNLVTSVRAIDASTGTTPSFAWTWKWGADAHFYSQLQTAWTVTPGDWTNYAATWEDGPSASGQATFPWSSFSLAAPGGQGGMSALLQGNGELSQLFLQTQVSAGHQQTGMAFMPRMFVLGAGSEVDISVMLSGITSVGAATPVTPVSGGISYPENGRAEVTAVLTDFAGIGRASFSQFVANEAFHQTDAVSLSFDQQVLTVTYRNTGTQPLSVVLDLQLDARVYEISTAVPEPGRWGLMLAGLLVVGVAARRMRR